MDDGKISNPLVRVIVKGMKDDVPQLIHKCPFYGHYVLPDTKPNKDFGTIFPLGVYRFVVKVVDQNKNEINVSLLLEKTE
jgi:hypothetical protein